MQRRVFTRFATVLLLAFVVAVDTCAQEPQPIRSSRRNVARAEELPAPQESDASMHSVVDLAERLSVERRLLRQELDRQRFRDTIKTIEVIEEQLADSQHDFSRRSNRIRKQIAELEHLLSETNPSPPPPPDLAPVPKADSASDVAARPTQPVQAPRPITESSVDRLSLADSLFGNKRFDTALAIYQSLDSDQLAADDQLWVNYQLACCHRRLGDIAKAEEFYRLVTASDSDGYLGKNARWWLDVIHRQIELEKRNEQINETLDSISGDSNE